MSRSAYDHTDKKWVDEIRRCSNSEKEMFYAEGAKCIATNRIIKATAQLRFGSKRLGSDGRDYGLSGDSPHVAAGK